MDHEGHRERLKERFHQQGLEGFAPHEALELLLMYAIPRRDTNAVAHQMIEHFGSLHACLEAPEEELMQLDGIGDHAATLISLLLPLFRMYEQDKVMKRPRLSTRAQVAEYCTALFHGATIEKFYVLCFDIRQTLIAAQCIAEGTLDEVQVYPRRVMSAVLRHNASGVVLTHNHPGGTLMPSHEDLVLTNTLSALLNGVGITLYDHVLVVGRETYSFSEHGMIG